MYWSVVLGTFTSLLIWLRTSWITTYSQFACHPAPPIHFIPVILHLKTSFVGFIRVSIFLFLVGRSQITGHVSAMGEWDRAEAFLWGRERESTQWNLNLGGKSLPPQQEYIGLESRVAASESSPAGPCPCHSLPVFQLWTSRRQENLLNILLFSWGRHKCMSPSITVSLGSSVEFSASLTVGLVFGN